MFEPRRARSSRRWRLFLNVLVVSLLLVAGLAVGWMLYLTRNPQTATAQTIAQPQEQLRAPAPSPPSPPVPNKPPNPAPQVQAKIEPPAALAPVPAPPATPAARPEPPAQPVLGPETAPAPVKSLGETTAPAPQSGDLPREGGHPLVFCYQGQAPDTRLLVVDKARQRVMGLRYLGEMTLEYEYTCSTGSQNGNKQAAGDERTPEGIYFTTHRFEDRKVTIFGDRAIHLNYPNPFDQLDQRQGHGIFIHGTNQKLRPRASNGCVVLQNQELALIASTIQEQLTPVVVMDQLRLPNLEERKQYCHILDGISLENLDQAEALLGNKLAIQPAPGRLPQPKEMQELEEMGLRLAGLAGKGREIKTETLGLAMYGVAGKWVLVARQRFTGPKNQQLEVSRRFYLKGDDPRKAQLVLGQWVVENTDQGRLLASWAPPLPPPAPAAPPKPVEVASAQPVAPVETKTPAAEPEPVKVAPVRREPAVKAPDQTEQQVHQMLQAWMKAWRTKNINAYITHYAPNFHSGGMDRRQWREHKAYLANVYKVIAVEASDIQIKVTGNRAKVTFVQHYRSDWHQDVGRKQMELTLKGGQWQIQSETWDELPSRPAGGRRQGRS